MTQATNSIQVEKLTKDERNALLYAECCLVDYGGLIDGERINADDIDALNMFKEHGLLNFGRVPSQVLGTFIGRKITHWVEFTDAGWQLAHKLRRERCDRTKSTSTNYSKFRVAMDVRLSVSA